jgi:predicted nucleic acid-binding protein
MSMNVDSWVAEHILEGERLSLDASMLVSHLARTEEVSKAATAVISAIGRGRNEAVVSSMAIGELLVQPHRVGRDAVRRLVDFLDSLEELQIRNVDFLVAAEAARIRAATGIPIPDATIIATAVLTSSEVLVTNDGRQAEAARRAVPELRVVVLSEVAAVSSSA